jgi:signal transduction histidine kinase
VLDERHLTVLPDLGSAAAWPAPLQTGTALLVPLAGSGTSYGVLVVAYEAGTTNILADLDVAVVETFAGQAALALERTRARGDRDLLAVLGDRERIARDLHDTVIQRLFAEGLSLQAALSSVGDPQRTRARLESAVEGLDETIKELRMAVFSLHGAPSAPGGFRGRMLQVVTDATDGLGFEPRLQFDGPVETIDVRIADQLIPVLREALSNIAHHAKAGHARVAVTVAADVTLTVSDDGVGVPAEVFGGRGLTNLAARARDLGGDFTMRPQPSGGSLLTWQVPAQR